MPKATESRVTEKTPTMSARRGAAQRRSWHETGRMNDKPVSKNVVHLAGFVPETRPALQAGPRRAPLRSQRPLRLIGSVSANLRNAEDLNRKISTAGNSSSFVQVNHRVLGVLRGG